MTPPLFQTTIHDLQLKRREVMLEINDRKKELDVLEERCNESSLRVDLIKSEGADAIERIRDEVDVLEAKRSMLEHDIGNINTNIVVGNADFNSLSAEIKSKEKELMSVVMDIKEAMIQSDKSVNQTTEDQKETSKVLLKNNIDKKKALSELSKIKEEVITLRKEIKEGKKELEKDQKYNKEWDAVLHLKERDLELRETKLNSKVKKKLPYIIK